MSKAYEIHKEIEKLAQVKNTSSLALGEKLYAIKEGRMYRDITGDNNFSTYLGSPEIKISPSTAFRYIAIYKKYIKELGLGYEDIYGLDTASLYTVAKVVNKENIDEWLTNVKELSRSDIIRLVKFPDTDVMDCEHKWKEDVRYKCEKCGEITRNI